MDSGLSWELDRQRRTELNHPGIRRSGTFDYKCIINSKDCISSATAGEMPDALFSASDRYQPGTSAGEPGYYAQTPWAYSATNHVFMSYDDAASTAYKVQHIVNAKNLRGAFIWEVDGDIPPQIATTRATVFCMRSIATSVKPQVLSNELLS
ncbi:glycosyl hydrolase family 18 protein [Dongshaea marina]|uniref:glycosyl hydrolase family 18 protein n=1 Tax=Dongshaea marina TaxID=2047966 RepID=UPI00131F40C4|nr:glycosyl hydrolase family 18 protein [Dongshaea marina]